jgi:hypothetical protein
LLRSSMNCILRLSPRSTKAWSEGANIVQALPYLVIFGEECLYENAMIL